jgi:hypothetical protein
MAISASEIYFRKKCLTNELRFDRILCKDAISVFGGVPMSDNKITQNLVEASAEQVFNPTPSMRKCKAKLLVALEGNPSASLETITLQHALQLTKVTTLEKWWIKPGFKDWLRNAEEFKSSLEYLCNLGMETAEDILTADDARSVNAKVSLIKILLEAGGKINRQKEVKLLDEAIAKMDKHQLEEYLKKAKKLKVAE